MVVNSRYLVFPCVRSKFLASSVPAMAARRLADDWERIHGWRPVLRGTFADGTRFRASCCRAANRERVGETAAGKVKSVKGVYVMPLDPACRGILRGGGHVCFGCRHGPLLSSPRFRRNIAGGRGLGKWSNECREPVLPFPFRKTPAASGRGWLFRLNCQRVNLGPCPQAGRRCERRTRPGSWLLTGQALSRCPRFWKVRPFRS